ncbi:polysaccharide biosynthesis protein [Halorhabdus utahensis DSM 12940]|uniref:Polysaccharide biosynthesis protein n=1 Tax=Halorhabdus utahensis (strain DSM 12940 / JCM 11049 / AX-2) TaxID=519442 RepID=C7NM90_HALUD|nr:polysaccharide biosynthesis C-terminal domain-containing protein [Halorhabdus utahensis]ACV11298.1 polysaccharide biosynthesis protein [Halorhabdus utahensis DSM 12940]
MSSSSHRTIVKQIFGTGGFELIGQLASFLGVIAYAQLVPQSILGSYFLLVAILGVISFIGATGVSTNITRRINQSSSPEKELMTATVFEGIVTVLLIVCIFLAQPVINGFVGQTFGVALLILLPVSTFSLLTGAVLRGEKKNTRAMILRTIQKVLTYFIGSVAIIFGIDPRFALMAGLFCGKFFEFGGGVLMMNISPSGIPQLKELQDLARKIVDLTATGLGSLGQEWVDTLLIGAISTPEMVAIYEVAWRLSAVGLTATNAVASVFYPRFAEAVDRENHHEIQRCTGKLFFYISVLMVAPLAGALAIGTDLVTIIFGTSYAAAYLPLVVLLAGRIPYSLSRILVQLGYSYNIDKGVARASLSAAVLNAVVNLFLISWIGIVGAAISSLISYIVLAMLLFQLLADRVGYPKFKQLFAGVVASGVMFVAVKLLSKMVPSNIVSLISLVIVGGAIFAIVLVALNRTVRSDLFDIVEMIKG